MLDIWHTHLKTINQKTFKLTTNQSSLLEIFFDILDIYLRTPKDTKIVNEPNNDDFLVKIKAVIKVKGALPFIEQEEMA